VGGQRVPGLCSAHQVRCSAGQFGVFPETPIEAGQVGANCQPQLVIDGTKIGGR